MPIRATHPSGTPAGESSVGAFGYATFITTGGSGTFEEPYTGVYSVEAANFNATTLVIELPFTVPMVFRVKRIQMVYIGGAPGVTLYPSVNLYYGGASTQFALGVPQVTTLATDQLVWEDMPWIVTREGAVNGCNVLANQRGNITMNHPTGYAATDDYRLVFDLEWVI